MRRNQKLSFIKSNSRPTLMVEDVAYWKKILSSILKVGLEHEFNLPDGTVGICKGDIYICPCYHPKKDERKCYSKCLMYKDCQYRKSQPCPGIYCLEFVSPCPTCKEAVRDCSKCYLYKDPDKDPTCIRENLNKELKPTDDVSSVGESGVLSITTDGSLKGGQGTEKGVEIITVGRRVHFDSLLNQTKKIMENSQKRGAYIDERTSTHVHLVGGYFHMQSINGKVRAVYKKKANNHPDISDLERHMPEIILANFHQMCRKYQNALVWLSSSGEDTNHLTRWIKFRQSVLKYSPARRNMPTVVRELKNADGYNGRYFIVNYYNMLFDRENDVSRLHVEVRHYDGLMSPSAAAALAVLPYAMMLRAVTLSQYGLLQIGNREEVDLNKNIERNLLNNNGDWDSNRKSDTSNFGPYKLAVINQAKELISLVKSELKGQGNCLSVLSSLAERPCSVRLCEGQSWQDIEEDLSSNLRVSSKTIDTLMQMIDTNYLDECESKEEWSAEISKDVDITKRTVNRALRRLEQSHVVYWDDVSGTYCRC